MRISIFTQDERVYLPGSVATLVETMPEKITSIILSPPMSTHGGAIPGLVKHLPVFGVKGTLVMGWRTIFARIGPLLGLKPPGRKYWSIYEVGKKFDVPTFYVENVNSDEMNRILDAHPADILVSVSCPQILRAQLLRRFAHGGINVHSAPLPKYRGLMPGFWILQQDETETAVTVHDLAERLDNGEILLQETISVTKDDTWDSLIRKTKEAAGHALVKAIGQIEAGTVQRSPNRDEESTYFSFPTWSDARLFRRRGRRMF
jgi:methionyl-tRNA formyltransferase